MKAPPILDLFPKVSDWLKFTGKGEVLVLTGRVELGQGNLTGLGQITAEELDFPLDKVVVTETKTDESPNEGFTSGSLSISQGGMALRLAASAARNLLLKEAAKIMQCPRAQVTIKDARIFNSHTGKSAEISSVISYVDWSSPILRYAKPKSPQDRKVAGNSSPRLDLPGRIGTSSFVHDMQMDGMMYGRILHPPCYGAKLRSLDIEALSKRKGVKEVVRDGDVVGVISASFHYLDLALTWAAREAVWDVPEFKEDRNPLTFIRNSKESITEVFERGAVHNTAGTKVTHEISKPFLCHGSIGPSAAVALFQNQLLRVWSHAQGPYPLRDAIAQVLDLPNERVIVQHKPGAGCYGHNGADDAAMDASLLAKCFEGTPIKVVWSRADEFKNSPLGPAMVTQLSATLSDDGSILGLDVLVNSASHGNRPGRNGSPNLRTAAFLKKAFLPSRSNDIPLESGGGADRNAVPLYDISNLRVRKRIIHDLPYRTSSMRSLGAFGNVYAIETLMDVLAARAGQNPFEYRLQHLSDERARAVLEHTKQLSETSGFFSETPNSSWGLGFAKYKNIAAYCAVIVKIDFSEEMKISEIISVLDAGEVINPDAVINQTEGGIIQAMSWGTLEAVKFEGCQVAVDSWLDYPIAKFSGVPRISVKLIPRPELPPMGCAEAAQGPTVAAIGNAIFRSIGTHVKDLPLTRDAIFSAALNS